MVKDKTAKKKKNKILKKKWFTGFLPLELFDGLKRGQIISLGTLLSVLLILSPIYIWLAYRPTALNNPFLALAKINAFLAISTLSVNFILAARLKLFENFFKGLDRMYRVHKFIGRSSLVFIILHPIFLMLYVFPDWDLILSFILPLGRIEVSIGIIAVYLFFILLALTVAFKLPYHIWHNTHKLLGIVLILSGLHAVIAGSNINSYPVLKILVIILCVLGGLAWIYMLVFYKLIGPKFNVTLDRVDRINDVTELYFKKPCGFVYQPGQYLFIKFPKFKGLKELFPFSISNDPSQKTTRVSIKKSGDFTTDKVPKLKKGDKAIIMGPYGRFGDRYLEHDKDMIWIAGGIGITPFLSLAKHESIHSTGRNINLIWVVKQRKDAFHEKEIKEEASKNNKFKYIIWESNKKGRISCEDVVSIIGGENETKNRLIFMCGPPKMMYSLSKKLYKMDISYKNIIFEDFDMLD